MKKVTLKLSRGYVKYLYYLLFLTGVGRWLVWKRPKIPLKMVPFVKKILAVIQMRKNMKKFKNLNFFLLLQKFWEKKIGWVTSNLKHSHFGEIRSNLRETATSQWCVLTFFLQFFQGTVSLIFCQSFQDSNLTISLQHPCGTLLS